MEEGSVTPGAALDSEQLSHPPAELCVATRLAVTQ
jgi:hypothetical protein